MKFRIEVNTFKDKSVTYSPMVQFNENFDYYYIDTDFETQVSPHSCRHLTAAVCYKIIEEFKTYRNANKSTFHAETTYIEVD